MQCALNNNQHPKQISAVSDALGSHQWDPAHKEKKKKKRQQKQESQQNDDSNGNGNSSNNQSESGTQQAQNHAILPLLWRKRPLRLRLSNEG